MTLALPPARWQRKRLRFRTHALAVVMAGAFLLATATPASAATWNVAATLKDAGHLWSVAVDPGNPSLMLAATDKGVFRSGDSGGTWAATQLTGTRVWTVGFDVRTPHTAFAGTAGKGAYLSAAGDGLAWVPFSGGLPNRNVRSFAFGLVGVAAGTDNGVAITDGQSWRPVGLSGVSISALTVAANSPEFTLVAGTDSGDVSKGAVFENNGSSWVLLGSGNGLPNGGVVSSLASGPITASQPRRPLVATLSKGTYRSLDGGQSWSASAGIPVIGSTNPETLTTVTFDPLDPNIVYAGADFGGSSTSIGGAVGLMRSTDAGANFSPFDDGLPGSSKNVESIAVAATTPPNLTAAINPAKAGPQVFRATDSGAPGPPQLAGESAGALIPTAVAAPATTGGAQSGGGAKPSASPQPGVVSRVVGAVFHWPIPLVYELLVVLLGVYVFIRRRQRSYVEGPP